MCRKTPLHQVHVALGPQVDLGGPLVRSPDDTQVVVKADDVGEWPDVSQTPVHLLLHPKRLLQDGATHSIQALE